MRKEIAVLLALAGWLGFAGPAQACSGAASDPIRCINGNQKINGFGAFFRDNLMPLPAPESPVKTVRLDDPTSRPALPTDLAAELARSLISDLVKKGKRAPSSDRESFEQAIAQLARALEAYMADPSSENWKAVEQALGVSGPDVPDDLKPLRPQEFVSHGAPATSPPQNNDFGVPAEGSGR
ncbi:MAG: hypothetical protein HZC25_04350 [Rhodospirillales bacterium]|nr:hypothetical protein [Rhodospirillales bacterium]